VEAFRAGLTPRTRVLLVSHVLFTTGQVMPVRDVVALGRAHGVTVIVDGAHAVGQLPFRIPDLACDFYGSTLHKWTMGPHGTGLLFVRRDRIRDVWPLFAAPPERDGDIRKFEEIGTHASALHNALLAAFDVHDAVGVEHVRARLLYLRDRWVERVAAWPGVRLLTDLRPEVSCGLASVSIDGVPAADAVRALWRRRRILVVEMAHAGLNAIRVTPAVYTQVEEIDLFVDALERWLSRRRG
jgi:isopenicillin-N epimerase